MKGGGGTELRRPVTLEPLLGVYPRAPFASIWKGSGATVNYPPRDKDGVQPEACYLVQADGESSLRHELDLQLLLSPLEAKTSKWLVGNKPAAAGVRARPRLLDLLVLGLPSLLFLCALVQNRPLQTETGPIRKLP